MHTTKPIRERFALAAALAVLALCTAYALSIWNYLRVSLGAVSPYSIFHEHGQFRLIQAIIFVLVIVAATLFERQRASLSSRYRWVCLSVLSIAVGHLITDLLLRFMG